MSEKNHDPETTETPAESEQRTPRLSTAEAEAFFLAEAAKNESLCVAFGIAHRKFGETVTRLALSRLTSSGRVRYSPTGRLIAG